MNNAGQMNEAREKNLHHTALLLASQELESATHAARKAREDLRRATRNRLQAKERKTDTTTRWREIGAGTVESEVLWSRVEFAKWALEDAERNETDKLEDYRSALSRLEVLGATAGEADSHEVPAYLRHRARKAIALADAFGNKVAMDGTLHDGLERPVLPELEPEVEVQEFHVIDPLEPVEAWTPPEPRAVLVPVDNYSRPEDWEDAIPEDLRPTDEERAAAERFAFWREVNGAALEDEEKALEGTREDGTHEDALPTTADGIAIRDEDDEAGR